ncbi:MAG TPA: hypothetical protein DDY31_17630, partial [Lachnospiraceae bacterium]|nr:hypothetical protein [Lachnospiraceae bacterium]
MRCNVVAPTKKPLAFLLGECAGIPLFYEIGNCAKCSGHQQELRAILVRMFYHWNGGMQMKGTEIVVKALREEGVEIVFGYP